MNTLRQVGYDPIDYGLRSLRSVGITCTVHINTNSIPERLLKMHGRWKTDSGSYG